MAAPDFPRGGADVTVDIDPLIERYKAGIDRTLLRENLKLTVEQRLEDLRHLQAFAEELQRAGRRLRSR